MAVSKRKCKQCKEYSEVEKGVKVPAGFFCSMEHALVFASDKRAKQKERQIKKAKQVQAKKIKADKSAVREAKRNDRKHQFDLTKAVLQKWVNHVRDARKPCISCGTTNPNIVYAGGHYKTAGGNPEIAIESKNIHRQCNFTCNMNKSGNIAGDKHSIGFKQGLIERYGLDYVDWLESYHPPRTLDCDQLRELRAYYNRLIREKKKTDEDRPFF